jgi:hypothetical protein
MDPTGEHGGVSLTGESEGNMNFQGMGCTRFCSLVSLRTGHTGDPQEGVRLEGTVIDIGRVLEMEHLSLWELC